MKNTYHINGMTCENCAKHVTKALQSVKGVKSAKVNLKKGLAEVKTDGTADPAIMAHEVKRAGYEMLY
jgi:copper chaperone